MAFTDAHLATATVASACTAVGTSQRTLRRRFLAETGMTWREYVLQSRLLRAMGLLAGTDRTVLDIAVSTGFDSPSGFTRAFRTFSGQSPSEYRRRLR